MATRTWLGEAAAVAQIDTATPATVEIGDIFDLILTSEDGATTQTISYTAAAATVADVVAGLVAAWNASPLSMVATITAADVGTTHLTLTADTAGVPFYLTTSTTDGGGNDTQTLTRAASTANSGPNDFNCVYNWTDEDTPDAADDVHFRDSSVDCLYGLDQNSVALTSLTIDQSYTGKIGSATIPLKICATTVTIGQHHGAVTPSGSRRINLNLHTTATTVTIHNSAATASETGRAPVRLLATNAANVLNIRKGYVAVANGAGETSQFATINVSFDSNIKADADLVIGSGVTLTTLNADGGDVILLCAATTAGSAAGTLETDGSGAITTLTVGPDCAAVLKSSGTITTLHDYGAVDLRPSLTARTITNTNLYAGATYKADWTLVTNTNGFDLVQCGLADVTLELGDNLTVTPSAI